MSRPIPYLSEEAIERDAAALLHDYATARGVQIVPPIPIEDFSHQCSLTPKLRFSYQC